MTTDFPTILRAARELPTAQRALLVDRLLETIAPEEEDFIEVQLGDEEMLAELERRRREVQDGKVTGISWSDLGNEQ